MINRVMAGTLTALSTALSPLAPLGGDLASDANAHHLVVQGCHASKSALQMRLSAQDDRAMRMDIEGQVCTGKAGHNTVNLSLILPLYLIDKEFLAHLPDGASFVVAGADSANPQVHFKISRGIAVAGLSPLTVEWLPDAKGHSLHAPITLWLQPSTSHPGAHLENAEDASLPWARLTLPLSGSSKDTTMSIED